MENILTMRWSNDFIRHLPYNETWDATAKIPKNRSHISVLHSKSPKSVELKKKNFRDAYLPK